MPAFVVRLAAPIDEGNLMLARALASAVMFASLASCSSATHRPRTDVDTANSPKPAESTSPTIEETGCPPTRAHPKGLHIYVDYVSFIVLGGQEFLAGLDEVPPMKQADLGERIATVRCTIADLTQNSRMGVVGSLRDGNAAYLKVGTPIYGVDGFPPSCRVAVIADGKVVPYLAHREVDNHSVAAACAITPTNAPKKQPVQASQVTISTHCGVVSVLVKGGLWLASPRLGDHNPPRGWDENWEAGTFSVTGSDTADFRTENGLRASFVRAAPGTPDPNSGCE